MVGKGHNSGDEDFDPFEEDEPGVYSFNEAGRDLLQSTVERIERIEEEARALAADKKEVYAEAKSRGLDTAVIRKLIALRKLDPNDVEEARAILELYQDALKPKARKHAEKPAKGPTRRKAQEPEDEPEEEVEDDLEEGDD